MRTDFCVFILSHGRPDNIITLTSLNVGNYSGRYYIVIDTEDETAEEYHRRYGDKVITFDKRDIARRYDTGDNFNDRRTVFYARNACFEIAERLGVKYFLELDDDYTGFLFRVRRDGKLRGIYCRQLDRLFADMIDFLDASGALTVALAQGGDFIGGAGSTFFSKGIARKAMNTFFCKTSNPVNFVGRINEDVNTYISRGIRGDLLLTVTNATVNQNQTQKSGGGMTDVYLDTGTYVKSFYSVMYAPSCVKVGIMPSKYKRMHHKVSWDNCTPKILNEKWRKTRG